MKKNGFEIITLNESNITTEHICCAIGNDKVNQARSRIKKAWLQERLSEGLIFKKLNARGKVFIEYIPAESAWKPIDAPGYMCIHCLWVSGRYKKQGFGAKLLNECLNDAKDKNGVVVVSSNKNRPFLTDKKFFTKYGFEVCDTAPPYFELLVKKFKDAPSPRFQENAKKGTIGNTHGLTFIYSDQCPFTAEYVDLLTEVANEYNIPVEKIKLTTKEEVQDAPSAFATFAIL